MLSCVVLINSVLLERRVLTALPHWSLRRPLRRPIAPIASALYLVLFAIRQLLLLREEFRLSNLNLLALGFAAPGGLTSGSATHLITS